MKKILIVSDSVMKCTGYGIVSRNIINKLLSTNKFEIAQLGLNNASSSVDLPIHYYTMIKDHSRCCGKGSVIEYTRPDKKLVFLKTHPLAEEHPDQRACYKGNPIGAEAFGYNSVYFIINHFKPDIVVPINDLWGLYNTAYIRNRESYKLVPYLAIDSECMFPVIKQIAPGLPPIDMITTIGSADKVIVFTEWAKEVLNKTCRILFNKEFNNISIIPHGVDTSTWKPLTNRDELRKLNFNIDDNTFLLGCVSRNQPRKRFDAILQTARIFIDKYENKTKKLKIYFHCQPYNDLGWDLPWLAKYYGIDDRCIFNNELKPGEGPSIEHLNELVNCFDAHMLLSNSEGWCSFGNTRIITPDGIKQLQDLDKDDLVITHNGNINRVIEPLSRHYTGIMYGFKYLGSSSTIWFTPNHRLLVANKELTKEWIPAGFVNKNHYLCLPKYKKPEIVDKPIDTKYMIEKYTDYKVVKKDNYVYGLKNNKPNLKSKPITSELIIDEKTAEFIGNYIAEGSCGHNDIKISINASSDDIIRNNTIEFADKLKLKCKSYIMERNRENICIVSRTLSNIFKSFGSKACNKKIPIEIFNILKTNENLCKKFLNGVIEGDGHTNNKNGVVYTTTSETLSYQIKYLFLTLGIYSKIYITKRKTNIDSIVVQIQQFKDLKKCKEFINKCSNIDFTTKRREVDYILEDDDYFYIPIRKMFKKEYSGKVYNISVENDESYITDGFAVHNCLPLLETAAAGIPNITTKYSAMADWGKDTLLFAKVAAYEHEANTGFVKALVDVEHAAKQLQLLYASPKMCREYGTRGVKLGQKLDWNKVTDKWVELLDSIPLDFKEDRFKDLDPEKIAKDLEEIQNQQLNLRYMP